MIKRILVMLIMLMLPALALAEYTPEYQVFTFAEALPAQLVEPLTGYISAQARIVSGAAIEYDSSFVQADALDTLPSYSALLLVDTPEGLRMFAAARVGIGPWQFNDFTYMLRRDRNVFISVYWPMPFQPPLFSVDYTEQDGLVSDLMIFRGNRLWCMDGHINSAHDVKIDHYFDALVLQDNAGHQEYMCNRGFWLEYMTSIAEYPTCRADLEALENAAHSAVASDSSAGWAYAQGVHLREKATSTSASLGQYNQNVPVLLLGEKADGYKYPWVKVRIGNTEGWMSSNYVSGTCSQTYPVPLGRTVDICPLYAAIDDTQPAVQLTPGTTFHILTEIAGLYHICIPQSEISCEVDRDGLYGYIPKENVLTGYSPSILDALESAR